MAIFGFHLRSSTSGRAKCQYCRELIPKVGRSIYIYHYFTGDGGYFHEGCITKLVSELPDLDEAIAKSREKAS